jgi:hypothetical protein
VAWVSFGGRNWRRCSTAIERLMVLNRLIDRVEHFLLCPCVPSASAYTVMRFKEAARDVVSVSSVLAAILCSSDSATRGRVKTWSFMESDPRSRYRTGKQHATPLAGNIEFGRRCTISWRTRSQCIEYGTGSVWVGIWGKRAGSEP